MTDKELRKLNRAELLELLLEQSRKIDSLQEQLEQSKKQLTDRQLMLNRVGSIAEASLQINGVFEAAQKAAEQYLDNIRYLSERQESISAKLEQDSRQQAEKLLADTQAKCQAMEDETRLKCTAMVRESVGKVETIPNFV